MEETSTYNSSSNSSFSSSCSTTNLALVKLALVFLVIVCLSPVLLLLSLSGSVNAQTAIDDEVFATYENLSLGIRTQYPADWEVEEQLDIGGAVSFFPIQQEEDPSSGLRYREGINIIVVPSGNRTLDEAAYQAIEARRQSLLDFELLELNQTATLAGNPARMFVYVYTDPIWGETMAMEIGTVQDDKVYAIEYFADPNTFSIHLSIVQRSTIGSFEIIIPQVISDDDDTISDTSAAVAAGAFKTYENREYGISLQHPSDWAIKENAPPNPIVDFISPPEHSLDKYFESVELYVYSPGSLPYFPTSDTAFDDNLISGEIQFLADTFTDFRLLDSYPLTTAKGYTAHAIEFTHLDPESGLPEGGLTNSLDLITKIGDNIYIIFYNAEPAKYSNYFVEVGEIIDSFEVTINNNNNTTNNTISSTTTAVTTTPANNITSSSDTTTSVDEESFFRYENPTIGIRLQYPGDWQEQHYERGVSFFAPPEDNSDRFKETLSINSLPGNLLLFFPPQNVSGVELTTLDKFSAGLINYYNSTLDDFELIESNITNVTTTKTAGGGYPVSVLVYTYSGTNFAYNDFYSGMIKSMNVLIDGSGGDSDEGSLYLISYLAEPAKYSKYLSTVNKMISSFEILVVEQDVKTSSSSSPSSFRITQQGTASLNQSIGGDLLPANDYILTVEISGNYTFNPENDELAVVVDNDSISGTLFGIDNPAAGYAPQIQMNLDIQNFTVSADLRTIMYNATLLANTVPDAAAAANNITDSQQQQLAGTVSGSLVFQNPVDFESAAAAAADPGVLIDIGRQESQESEMRIMLNSEVLVPKNNSTGEMILFG